MEAEIASWKKKATSLSVVPADVLCWLRQVHVECSQQQVDVVDPEINTERDCLQTSFTHLSKEPNTALHLCCHFTYKSFLNITKLQKYSMPSNFMFRDCSCFFVFDWNVHLCMFSPLQPYRCDRPVSQDPQTFSSNRNTEDTSEETHLGLDGKPSCGPAINNEKFKTNLHFGAVPIMKNCNLFTTHSPLVHNTAGGQSSCWNLEDYRW